MDWNAETAIAKDDALDNESGRNKTKSIRQPGKVGSGKLGVESWECKGGSVKVGV